MDYTTLQRVKDAMDSQETVKDTVLSEYITRASRMIDRYATGIEADSDNYFTQETKTGEVLTNGDIDYAGRLICYPHKPIITSVSQLQYRFSLKDAWQIADINLVIPLHERVVFEGDLDWNEFNYVSIDYTGGLSTTTDGLPLDLIDLATMLAVRFYKEARSGLGDSIGVAELATLTYTKALPLRFQKMMEQYKRVTRWT